MKGFEKVLTKIHSEILEQFESIINNPDLHGFAIILDIMTYKLGTVAEGFVFLGVIVRKYVALM